MDTGEDSRGLRKIIDLTRLISGTILILHFYITCYILFAHWGWTAKITTRLVANIARTSLFHSIFKPKLAALLFLVISLMGAKGKKDEDINKKTLSTYIVIGAILYFASVLCFHLPASINTIAISYVAITSIGYLLILSGGTQLSRLLKDSFQKDIFNTYNESFPQEERLLQNEYSINLPAKYNLKGEIRNSWINVINPFRGLLVAGTPGAGKSYFVIRHIIDQHIKKGFSMFIYDFKYDDLSIIAYNALLRYYKLYPVKPKFYVISFDEIRHRCNPLDPASMEDITDATEASRTIMLGLNREWISKQGDFFVESPINFLTAIIWYLRKYENGRYCTLPHVIELMQAEYDHLFAVLQQQEEVKVLVNPFISAYQNKAMEQLEGQIASAKIGLARLSSPQLYYVLSGNDFTLDINNPSEPKIVCVGNNPQKLQTYGAVLSLYTSRMIKLVNRKGQLKSSLIFDEFPTIYFNNMDSLIATARSNKVATTIAVQDFSQLKKDYGGEQADVITGIVGNIISGQVTGDTAAKLSDNFGKIVQDKNSKTIMSDETSITRTTAMDYAIPASKISALSSGEFVGMVADNPEEKIKLKMFHAEIQQNHEAIAREIAGYKEIPKVGNVTAEDIQANYQRIKKDVGRLIAAELKKLDEAKANNPEQAKYKSKKSAKSRKTGRENRGPIKGADRQSDTQEKPTDEQPVSL
ncbi:conjugal transfer protein MobC [Mucilaginibacter sp. X4EP1]|uniref:conjugal transfer protein MobC n=1 Tax=Mucilaginibacter sp. X4EP1 TaxID=2723092 RepID=UPI0021687F10|nr:conjugal transfer protein MobC [Mucilaginibacter sp. X4EP1]MCS3815496.1 hypothetical protein [Mucilaginibacter sp. X4EP1]